MFRSEFFQISADDQQNCEELNKLNKNNRLKKQVTFAELALADIIAAQKLYTDQLTNEHRYVADLTPFPTWQTLLQKILSILQITTSGDKLFITPDYRYDKDTICNSGFLEWIDEHRQIYQGIIVIPSLQRLKEDPIRFLAKILSKMGIKQKRVERASKGLYHIDMDRINLLNALITRRRAGIAGRAMQLIIPDSQLKAKAEEPTLDECLANLREALTIHTQTQILETTDTTT